MVAMNDAPPPASSGAGAEHGSFRSPRCARNPCPWRQNRLIDIPISNCLHAGLKRIFVLTQFNSASLNRHIAQTYRLDVFSEGFVEVLAAEQTPDSPTGFRAPPTPCARRRATSPVRRRDYLILAGDISTGWTSVN